MILLNLRDIAFLPRSHLYLETEIVGMLLQLFTLHDSNSRYGNQIYEAAWLSDRLLRLMVTTFR